MKTGSSAARALHCLMLLLPMLASAAEEHAPAAAPELDEVLVVGEQPGPAMWKVSKDGHTMWVMGTLTPVPAKMTWRSKEAEGVIERSGEVLGSTSARASADIGLFGALRLIPAIMRALKNPDGSTLHDALPADVYMRFSTMHRHFYGKDPDADEKDRPLYAADQLYRQALKKSGLTESALVWPTVEKLAKRHKVRIRERAFEIPVDDPKGMIADLARIPRDQEVTCLNATMDYIDRELPNIKQRATAWAVGDLPALRALPQAVTRIDCLNAVLDALKPRIEDQMKKVRTEIAEDRSGIFSWMLLTHETSFSVLPIEDLLSKDGAVARWRAAGYTVEEPQ